MTNPVAPAVGPRTFAVLAACVTLLALGLVAALVGLFALTAPANRPDLTPLFSQLSAGVPALVGVVVVFLNSKRQHAQSTAALATITSQTNGILTDRITAGVAQALQARDAAALVAGIPIQAPAPAVEAVARTTTTTTTATTPANPPAVVVPVPAPVAAPPVLPAVEQLAPEQLVTAADPVPSTP